MRRKERESQWLVLTVAPAFSLWSRALKARWQMTLSAPKKRAPFSPYLLGQGERITAEIVQSGTGFQPVRAVREPPLLPEQVSSLHDRLEARATIRRRPAGKLAPLWIGFVGRASSLSCWRWAAFSRTWRPSARCRAGSRGGRRRSGAPPSPRLSVASSKIR